jgi:hypothetical protein
MHHPLAGRNPLRETATCITKLPNADHTGTDLGPARPEGVENMRNQYCNTQGRSERL